MERLNPALIRAKLAPGREAKNLSGGQTPVPNGASKMGRLKKDKEGIDRDIDEEF